MTPEEARAKYDAMKARAAPTPATEMRLVPGRGRQMKIAAMYLLGASYNQVAMLFGVSRSAVIAAVYRHATVADMRNRPPTHSKPLIHITLAESYYSLLIEAGEQVNAATLAAVVKNLHSHMMSEGIEP